MVGHLVIGSLRSRRRGVRPSGTGRRRRGRGSGPTGRRRRSRPRRAGRGSTAGRSTPPSLGTWRARPSSSRDAAAEGPGRPVELDWRRRTRAGSCRPGRGVSARPAFPAATIVPWSRSAIRSASRSASSRYWVVRKIVTPVGDEVADDVPHHASAARVEPGRRLVEEDDPRAADQGHRQVEPAAHAARVRRDRLVGGIDEVEPLEQLGDPTPALGGRGGAGRPSGAGSPRR